MTELEINLLWLFAEVLGLFVLLASADGLITALRWIVRRQQRQKDHQAFVHRYRGLDRSSDPFGYDDGMPPVTTLTKNTPKYRIFEDEAAREMRVVEWSKPADQIVIEGRRGKR